MGGFLAMKGHTKASTLEADVRRGEGDLRLPTRYDQSKLEALWQRNWEETRVYRYDPSDRSRPTYSIDTPPPYPSGEFHMGNALNWC